MLIVMEKIISVTDLVRNAASIAREVETEGTVYRITRGGRGSMVLVDEDYFNGWMAALDEMRRPDWREVHERTTRDIAAGRGRDLDAVAKELGLEDRPHAGGRRSTRRTPRARSQKGRRGAAAARGRTP
jgi:PHD/YefM family antitoxin component YafN of YafNO toxin-antitoxin module